MEPQLATLAQLNGVLREARFLDQYQFEVKNCAARQCELIVPFRPELERPGGIVSGMTIVGAADVAMWLAIMTTRGTSEVWITSDITTAFLRSGSKESLRCIAQVLRIGRQVAYCTVETLGSISGLLAHHVVTYARKREHTDTNAV
jgi:uncharacterized protein (TIGR00369 family)